MYAGKYGCRNGNHNEVLTNYLSPSKGATKLAQFQAGIEIQGEPNQSSRTGDIVFGSPAWNRWSAKQSEYHVQENGKVKPSTWETSLERVRQEIGPREMI